MSKAEVSANSHDDYNLMAEYITAIEDCMIGSPKIKGEGYLYLPHPSQIDTTSKEQRQRYVEYKAGAEFDSYPDDTRRELLGKMKVGDTVIELPAKLGYLIDDIDGNGVASDAALEYAVNNVYQFKFHALIADYKGVQEEDKVNISKYDQAQLKTRAVIKQYVRSSIINWNFSNVNGIDQLSFIQFMEVECVFDANTGNSEDVEQYLVLALDENGDYYQAKYKEDESLEDAKKQYVKVNNAPLKAIPLVFVADEELKPNELPIQLGYLWGVCDATLARYRVSAEYKESIRNLAPTIMTGGWKQGDVDIFKEANNGRTYIATGAGAVNNMPEGVTSEILNPSMSLEGFERYLETNEKKIKLMGGSVSNQGAVMTATEADISAAKQNALMNTVSDNAEDALKRMFFWCGVFEGIYTLEAFGAAMDELVVTMPRDFASPKLSTEEAKEYREMMLTGAVSLEEYQSIMENGGWLSDEVEDRASMIEEQPPLATGSE